MNAQQLQATTNPQTKPTNLGCNSACMLAVIHHTYHQLMNNEKKVKMQSNSK